MTGEARYCVGASKLVWLVVLSAVMARLIVAFSLFYRMLKGDVFQQRSGVVDRRHHIFAGRNGDLGERREDVCVRDRCGVMRDVMTSAAAPHLSCRNWYRKLVRTIVDRTHAKRAPHRRYRGRGRGGGGGIAAWLAPHTWVRSMA